jgi:hypothetical protein
MSGQIETKRDYTADVAVRDFMKKLPFAMQDELRVPCIGLLHVESGAAYL